MRQGRPTKQTLSQSLQGRADGHQAGQEVGTAAPTQLPLHRGHTVAQGGLAQVSGLGTIYLLLFHLPLPSQPDGRAPIPGPMSIS